MSVAVNRTASFKNDVTSSETSNPFGPDAEVDGDPQLADIDLELDIEAALAAGSVSVAEAVGLLQKRVAALDSGGGPQQLEVEKVVKDLFARLAEAPPNLHQFIVFLASSRAEKDSATKKLLPWMIAGSVLMVLVQAAVSAGVLVGTAVPTCATNAHCTSGTYCHIGGRDRCNYCGSTSPIIPDLKEDGDRDNIKCHAGSTAFKKGLCNTTLLAPSCHDHINYYTDSLEALETWNVAWCEGCINPVDGVLDPTTANDVLANNVAMMGPFDLLALAFASFVVAITVVGELKDITLCNIAIARAGANLSPPMRRGLKLVGGARRWVFLPALVLTIPLLVCVKGGDALSVCFNTLAILFMCEVDNVAYTIGLSERVRTRYEQRGRVELTTTEATAMVRSKVAHVSLIVFAVLLTVESTSFIGGENPLIASTLLVFLLGGMVEAFVPDTAAEVDVAFEAHESASSGLGALATCQRIGMVFGSWFCGLICIGILSFLGEKGKNLHV